MRHRILATAAVLAALASAAPAAAQEPAACRPWQARTLASGLGSLENLSFDRRGGLLLSATGPRAILRLTPDGRTTTLAGDVAAPGGQVVRGDTLYVNTGAAAPSGVLGTADGTIEQIDVRTGARRTWARDLVMPNGLALLPSGDAVVTRSLGSGTGMTRVPASAPDRPQYNWADVEQSNGLVLDAAGEWLYSVDTFTAQARVFRVNVADPRRVEVLAELGNANGPKGLDDITIDRAGLLYLAANGAGQVLRFDPATRQACVIATGIRNASAVKLGEGPGWSGQKLYVTAFDGAVRELTPPPGGEPAGPVAPPPPPPPPPAPRPPSGARTLAVLGAAQPIAAYGGLVAYSVRSDGGWVLAVRERGRVRTLRMRSRRVPFDVDAGPGPGGRPMLAYSRCRREPPAGPRGRPDHLRGRGCDLYLYDVRRGRERRIAGPSLRRTSEVLPSYARGEVAFVRVYRRRPLVFRRKLGARRSRRVQGARRGRPVALDLARGRLAVQWSRGGRGEIRLAGRGTASRAVAAGTVFSPSFDRGDLFFRQRRPSRQWRHRPRDRSYAVAGGTVAADAAVRAAGRTYALTCAPCRIVLEPPARFRRARAPRWR